MASGYAYLCHAVDDGIAVAFIAGGLGGAAEADVLRLDGQQPVCLYLPAFDINTFFGF